MVSPTHPLPDPAVLRGIFVKMGSTLKPPQGNVFLGDESLGVEGGGFPS